MDAVLAAVADPNRRVILDALRERPRAVGELAELLPIAQSGVSRHLAILRDAGLVESSSDAQRRIYRLTPAPLGELDRWLAPYRDRWLQSFDALHTEIARGRRTARAAAANAADTTSEPSTTQERERA
ncbi:MAG: winged helix-turn-helix transcriptional regulator [Actinomycetales bacterium]|nr:winged helix-turn-helix transcriptional regulator [Actinomycetales bacterium]